MRPPSAVRRLRDLVRSAVDDDRLEVVYQPVADLRTGALVGAEALLRMRDAAGGAVGPDVFIPVAEATGAIHEIGTWVAADRGCAGSGLEADAPVGREVLSRRQPQPASA